MSERPPSTAEPSDAESLRLIRAFLRILDRADRERVITLAEALADRWDAERR